jgi:regulator of cell morphogenesis and NO signaling
MTIDTTRTVSEIVAEDYRTAAVFQSHGIDFCCGGKISLDEVCKNHDINPRNIG